MPNAPRQQPRTAVPAALIVGYSRDYITSTTGNLDAEYIDRCRRGKVWLRKLGIVTGRDIEFLAWLCWHQLSVDMLRGTDVEPSLVVGDVVDLVTDDEAVLLNQVEASLQARTPKEGAGTGSMSPEVTALFDLLCEVCHCMVDSLENDDTE